MKIILATGGSAGHVFPSLAVARELKKEGHQIYFVGAFEEMKEQVLALECPLQELPVRRWNMKTPGAFFTSLLYMLKSIKESAILLKNIRPDVVVGFGGYGAFPVVLAACFLKVPSMIHEQNVRPGKANRLLAGLVPKVAVSFETSRRYFRPAKTVFTGYPCYRVNRRIFEKSELTRTFRLREDRATVFVLGGSQGSHRINSAFVQTIPLLKKDIPFQVIHISGKKDYPYLEKAYGDSGIPFYLAPFVDEVDKAYQAADCVIARSGAGTVSEIAAFGVPAVLIPYPYAHGHQKDNALELVRTGQARLLEESGLTPEGLADEIRLILRRKTGGAGPVPAGIFVPDAAERLAREIVATRQKFQERELRTDVPEARQ